jgi:transcriptional regulator with PAS, ATPase and Fis domain
VERLMTYPWPGNVRELENVIERILVLTPPDVTIRPDHLPTDLLEGPAVTIQVREQVLAATRRSRKPSTSSSATSSRKRSRARTTTRRARRAFSAHAAHSESTAWTSWGSSSPKGH